MDRQLPAWFDDAKFGIFVHWTAAAIPAFAPIDAPHDWFATMGESPYVEWYQNSFVDRGQLGASPPHGALRRSAVRRVRRGVPRWHPRVGPRRVGRAVRIGRCAVRRTRDQAPRRGRAVADRTSQPVQRTLAIRARCRRRTRQRGAQSRHAVRHVLLGRTRLDLRRTADDRPPQHDCGDPAERRLRGLCQRALARTHRALRAVV